MGMTLKYPTYHMGMSRTCCKLGWPVANWCWLGKGITWFGSKCELWMAEGFKDGPIEFWWIILFTQIVARECSCKWWCVYTLVMGLKLMYTAWEYDDVLDDVDVNFIMPLLITSSPARRGRYPSNMQCWGCGSTATCQACSGIDGSSRSCRENWWAKYEKQQQHT